VTGFGTDGSPALGTGGSPFGTGGIGTAPFLGGCLTTVTTSCFISTGFKIIVLN
jgi:hypothetical protein